jgi:hypothetical protein
MRASTSLAPPGVKATTRVTGRLGYSAAEPAAIAASSRMRPTTVLSALDTALSCR